MASPMQAGRYGAAGDRIGDLWRPPAAAEACTASEKTFMAATHSWMAYQLLQKEPAFTQMPEDLTVPLHIKEGSSAAQTEQ